jgi:hypothetical protein
MIALTATTSTYEQPKCPGKCSEGDNLVCPYASWQYQTSFVTVNGQGGSSKFTKYVHCGLATPFVWYPTPILSPCPHATWTIWCTAFGLDCETCPVKKARSVQ